MTPTRFPQAARAIVSALALVGISGPAHAVDGVVEIHQLRVNAAGGFPFVISQAGSYRLTSDLVLTSPDVAGVRISADHVTLDLNGFAIRGPVLCSGQPLSCGPASSGVGVDGAGRLNVSVVNGAVRGMGRAVDLGDEARIENLRATSNASGGLSAGRGSRVSHCTASENGGYGIKVAEGSVVRGNTARANAGDGFELSVPVQALQEGRGSVLSGNASSENGGNGFDLALNADGVVLVGNTARLNGQAGIGAGLSNDPSDGLVLAENDVADNGGSGIVVGTGSLVVGNAARSNGADGIFTERGNRVVGNVLRANDEGLVLTDGLSGLAENDVTANPTNNVVSGPTDVGLGSNLCGAVICP